jgi:hypothetical protein
MKKVAKDKITRIYADMSVFGGVFDEEFRLYNAVNTLKGFGEIAIYSPLEVTEYED